MHRQLTAHNVSRYAFVRAAASRNLCSVHTAECLLADHGTATGNRLPSLEYAIRLASLAGYELTLTPKRKPASN